MRNLDFEKESKKIIDWIGKIFKESGMKKIVIGLSGGIDSSLSCALSSLAIGKENIIPVVFPYGILNSEGLEDAKLICDSLDFSDNQIVIKDIKSAVDEIVKNEDVSNIRKGNIMARVRMIYLFDLAKKGNAIVAGTENKSEKYLGYFTRFGDGASDFEPIENLYKTQVWEIAKYLKIPERIINKVPTAGLWNGQTDEEELGFEYKEADEILYYLIDEKLSENEIIEKGLNSNLVKNVLKRVRDNEFKHNLPLTVK